MFAICSLFGWPVFLQCLSCVLSNVSSSQLINLLWSSGMPPGGFAALMAAIAGNTAAIAVEGARSSNASALVHNDALRPVPNSLGVLPAVAVPAVWFPATLGVFTGAGPAGLTHLRADALLLFYNLPAMGGAVQNKRAAIGAHIGVRPR
jgi:hypothetical protein